MLIVPIKFWVCVYLLYTGDEDMERYTVTQAKKDLEEQLNRKVTDEEAEKYYNWINRD